MAKLKAEVIECIMLTVLLVKQKELFLKFMWRLDSGVDIHAKIFLFCFFVFFLFLYLSSPILILSFLSILLFYPYLSLFFNCFSPLYSKAF